MEKNMKKYFPVFVLPTFISFTVVFLIPFVLGIYLSFTEFTTVENALMLLHFSLFKYIACTNFTNLKIQYKV